MSSPTPDGADLLPLTGERTVPGVASENYWFRRHEAAYAFASTHVAGLRTLEVGCGEGYGTAMLAAQAQSVVGLDYDHLTVAHAARTYPQSSFAQANLAALPVRSGAAQVVATLQVIEHVWNHPEFMRECRRVLSPGGLLLVTTPNRLTFSPGRQAPVNPFHTHEFTAAELLELVGRCGFSVDALLGLHPSPRLASLDQAHGGSFADAQLATPPQGWHEALRRDVAAVTTDDFAVLDAAAVDVNACLDLVVLARRAGA